MLRNLPIIALVAAFIAPLAAAQAERTDLQPLLQRSWADDPIWYDGQAEIATYQATRRIYGSPRAYTAQIMINKERMSPDTFTKSQGNEGFEVFKLHVRDEDIPTAKYDYNFSTMVYVSTEGFIPFKLDMGSQEDCGASFKRFQIEPDQLFAQQYSYFPNQGFREMRGAADDTAVWLDALPLLLRGYPFDAPLDPLTIAVVPEQTTTKWSPIEPDHYRLAYAGRESLDLPIGNIDAHKLTLTFVGPTRERRPDVTLHFHADPATGHPLVAYDDPHLGQTYRLQQLARDAYWR
ncbi:MAG: hypothetical protein AAF823_10280 [Planctomycetota bacterium]